MTVHDPAPLFQFANRPDAQRVVSMFDGGSDERISQSCKIAMVGTFTPRKCGIATFTSDLVHQLAIHHPRVSTMVYALDQAESSHDYSQLAGLIDSTNPESYARAARAINASAADAVWLQHEFGIFGGPDGEMVCDLADRLAAPLIVTFHTVLSEPSANQRRIVEHLLARASRIMVMSQHGQDLLVSRYHAPPELISVIPHGAPDRPFGREAEFKTKFDLGQRHVIMTFGLLGPGKGLERVIEALPAIIMRHPNTVYRIVGATHPVLLGRVGESYREGLIALAERLGVATHVEWDNRFLATDELLDQLEACDVYVTPYSNLQQATSGTLSYAVALGKAVVSTPYVHARELLADGVGVLVEPNSSAAISAAVIRLLDDPEQLQAAKRRAYAAGRRTIWPRFADATAALVAQAIRPQIRDVPLTATPGLAGLFAMSDATGMLQHAIGVVPDRRHGYCLDDNARALILMNQAQGLSAGEQLSWSSTYASFIQYAWNPDRQVFRNFMRFERTWCEDEGSEDSFGRALWALGHTAAHSPDEGIAEWGRRWFETALPGFTKIDSPRAMAFATLGACAFLRSGHHHDGAWALVERSGQMLSHLLDSARRPDWAWFETVLGYDNPRLPQALLEAGRLLGRADWIKAGLETLDWIAVRQTAAAGHFRPVGSESFHRALDSMPFDQQPLEAQAAIEAASVAYAITGDQRWADHAISAYRWFFGANDRGAVLADLATGRCRDGVNPRGFNENCGAESILAFQLAYYSVLGMLTGTKPNSKPRGELEPVNDQSTRSLAHP